MTTTRSWRRLFAVPLAVSLALGGTLLAAVPANAAPPVISSPANGETVPSRNVTFTGTADPNAMVGLGTAAGEVLGGTTASASGAFSISYTFPADAATTQSLGIASGTAAAPEVTPITINLPAEAAPATPAASFAVTSPAAVSVQTSRTVTFTGTAPLGALVGVVDANRNPLAGPGVVGPDGTFSLEVTFPESVGLTTNVAVGGLYNGQILGPVTRSLAFAPTGTPTLPGGVTPPELLAAPVIGQPVAGSTVAGPAVTFSGVATPNDVLYLGVIPTPTAAQIAALPTQLQTIVAAAVATGTMPDQATVQAALASGIDLARLFVTRVQTDGSGAWSATLPLADGNYTAAAVAAYFNDRTDYGISLPSNIVNFTVAPAGVVVTPPVVTPPVVSPTPTPTATPSATATPKPSTSAAAVKKTTRSSSKGSLASTGAPVEGFIGFGLLLLLAGAAAIIVMRRLRGAQAK